MIVDLPNPLSIVRFSNGLELELRTEADQFLGIGAITTPDGIELTGYRIARLMAEGDAVHIESEPCYRAGGAVDWILHETRARDNTADWTQGEQPAEATRSGFRGGMRASRAEFPLVYELRPGPVYIGRLSSLEARQRAAQLQARLRLAV